MHQENVPNIQTLASSETPRLKQRVREKIAGTGAASWAARARARRWDLFLECFPDFADATVIDLGGTPQFWMTARLQPKHVTVVNLAPTTAAVPSWVDVITGDACRAHELVTPDRRYDLVFSNSTIEHVGGHDRCVAFANAVHALAPRHWIQTPYRYFPIEPHFVCPGFQFLPVALRWRVAAKWPLSYTKSVGGKLEDPLGAVLWTELLSRTHLQHYFPKSDILSERFLGLTKSLVAVCR